MLQYLTEKKPICQADFLGPASNPNLTNVLSIIDPLQQVQHCGIGTLELLGFATTITFAPLN